jgi:hypothetical protein
VTLVPPPFYDHVPTRPVVEHVMSKEEVAKWCTVAASKAHAAFPPGRTDPAGCSFTNKTDGKCYIIRVDDDLVRRHERAHCNGWKHNLLETESTN